MTKQEYRKAAQEKERQAFQRIDEMAKSFQVNPESIAEFLEFGTRFYDYSPRNAMLIRKQNPGATYVDSYVGWKEKGANVLKGSKALQILVPVNVTYLETENGWVALSRAADETKKRYREGKVNSRTRLCYKTGNVFDISQTDFPKEEYPKLFDMGYVSSFHEDICKGLADFSKQNLGCEVILKDLSSIALRGRYLHTDSPVIELNDKLESTQKLSTLSHELGHALIHAEVSGKSTSQKEFEADAFSIMLCAEFGIEITESRKKHLSDHYRTFRDSMTESIQGDHPERIFEKKLFESFSNVFAIYRENIEDIQKCVEEYVPREQRQENVMQEKKTVQEEENFPTGEPTVTIIWSEHSRFHDGETMGLSEANALMGSLDKAAVGNGIYFKTKFRIDFVMDGKPDYYVGRQDLGDGDGTLIDHVEKYHAYYANNGEWDRQVLQNGGTEALEADKAQRDMIRHKIVPYLKMHNNLSQMEQAATRALQGNGAMASTETAYHTAMQEYVSKCRSMVNQGNYSLPPAPQPKDFDTELEAYKEHVREEIAQEAAAAGMTVEEYAANGYEPYAAELPEENPEAGIHM